MVLSKGLMKVPTETQATLKRVDLIMLAKAGRLLGKGGGFQVDLANEQDLRY